MLIETVQDYAIFVLDPCGYVATWNNGAERIKGYVADEIVGQHFSVFYTPQDIVLRRPERELEIASQVGRVEDEGWRIRKDGSRFWANIIITALRDSTGTLTGFGKVTRDLTQRREVEESLRRSEERFRLLVEGIGDYAIYMLDPDGRVATWNTGAENIKGFKAAEIIGHSFSRFFTPEAIAAERPQRELEKAREDGRFEEEAWRVRKDGSRFWANVILTAVRGDAGQLIGFAKITRDLTQRRGAEETERQLIAQQAAREVAEAAEARLRREGERFRRLSRRLEVILEGVGDGITAQAADGRLLFANHAAARTCGFSSVDGLLAADMAELMSRFEILNELGEPFDVEQLPGRVALRTGEPATALLRVRDLVAGTDSWSRVAAVAVQDDEGQAKLAVNIWHDVTEEHLRERQERYLAEATTALSSSLDYGEMMSKLASLIVPGLADWCSINVLEGDELENVAIAHADPAKAAIARQYQQKYGRQERPSGVWSVIQEGRSELYENISDELLVQRAKDEEHLRYLRELGMKSVIVAPIMMRDRAAGTITLISTRPGRRYNQSDLVLVEELGRRAGACIENARLYAAATTAARLAEQAAKRADEAGRIKDEFLATVSHELRTPLNAIVGWAYVLRERNTDAGLVKGLDVIHRNAQAQAKIIEDILDVSRIITGKLRLDLKPADFAVTIRNAIEVVSASASAKQITIDFSPPSEPCVLSADHERLQQVVWNLLSNAVKFTPAGGAITIRLRADDAMVSLAVSDTGSGIDPQFLPYVFDRFKQADSSTTRRVGGLGLGLAIVRHIVELHGGRAIADSAGTDQGATFTIFLPASADASVGQGRAALPSEGAGPLAKGPAFSLQGVRVLVVDDEIDTRELLQTVLTNAGATVEAAATAATAFDVIQRFGPHVIVSDVGMPGEDGYSFIRRVRALPASRGGAAPAIALTAYTRGADHSHALSAGFTMHLGKPVNVADLVGAVAKLSSR